MADENKIADAMKQIFKSRAKVPVLEDMAIKMLAKFGGMDKFAEEYHDVFKSAPPMAKTRLMEGMVRLLLKANENQTSTDLSQIDDADLQAVLSKVVDYATEEKKARPAGGTGSDAGAGAPSSERGPAAA